MAEGSDQIIENFKIVATMYKGTSEMHKCSLNKDMFSRADTGL
jgi:hypothetical protein